MSHISLNATDRFTLSRTLDGLGLVNQDIYIVDTQNRIDEAIISEYPHIYFD